MKIETQKGSGGAAESLTADPQYIKDIPHARSLGHTQFSGWADSLPLCPSLYGLRVWGVVKEVKVG